MDTRYHRLLVSSLRNYRSISYGQFDAESRHVVPETQDAAKAIEELLAEVDRLTEENKRIEDERQMYITLALRYQKDAEENEPVWAELEGLENQVNRLWGNKAPSMVKVIVRAKALLEQGIHDKSERDK